MPSGIVGLPRSLWMRHNIWHEWPLAESCQISWMSWKSIGSRTQTVQVLIGTYELLAFRNLSGQLSRRSVDLHFRVYRAEDEGDIKIFQNIVYTFQARNPAFMRPRPSSIWDFLYERSVRVCRRTEGLAEACSHHNTQDGRGDPTRRTLEQTALSVAQCEKILAEAREGESRLTESADSRSRRGGNLPNRKRHHCRRTAEQLASAPAPSSPTNTRKPGYRDPQRDPVGRAQVAYA